MASGDTLGVFVPLGNVSPPASNYALFSTRNNIPVYRFDPSTNWSMIWGGILPSTYAGGGLTVTLYGMSPATSGDVKLGGSIERDNANNHDLDSDAFATEQTNTTTVNATSGKIFSTSLTFSSGANMDSLAAGEPFRFKLRRLATDAADTCTSDYQLAYIKIAET